MKEFEWTSATPDVSEPPRFKEGDTIRVKTEDGIWLYAVTGAKEVVEYVGDLPVHKRTVLRGTGVKIEDRGE